MTSQHGPFVYITREGLIVEATPAEIAAGQELIDAIVEAELTPQSWEFGDPRPYRWRDIIKIILTRRRGT